MAILECKNLTKRFGATAALQDVSLEIAPGRIIGLLGPNGSGKTTLLKLANGLLTPDGGTLAIDGMAPGVETKKIVSYLPEKSYLAGWMNVRQLLGYFSDFYADFQPQRAKAGHSPDPADQNDVHGHAGEGPADSGHEPGGKALSAR